MISVIILAACFMFLGVILILALLNSAVIWYTKALLIAALLLVTFVFYRAYTDTRGYPAVVPTPDRFRYLYSVVREPDEANTGAIYVWLVDTDGSSLPRVVTLPYSKPMRDQMNVAKQKTRNGETVHMERTSGANAAARKRQRTNTASASHGSRSASDSSFPIDVLGEDELNFVTPPDTLPEK